MPVIVFALAASPPAFAAGADRIIVPVPSLTKPPVPMKALLTFRVVPVSTWWMFCTATLATTGTVRLFVPPPVARMPPVVRVN